MRVVVGGFPDIRKGNGMLSFDLDILPRAEIGVVAQGDLAATDAQWVTDLWSKLL